MRFPVTCDDGIYIVLGEYMVFGSSVNEFKHPQISFGLSHEAPSLRTEAVATREYN